MKSSVLNSHKERTKIRYHSRIFYVYIFRNEALRCLTLLQSHAYSQTKQSLILATLPKDYSAAMALSSTNEYIDIPPVDDLDSKLYILAYLITVGLTFCGCSADSISSVLERYELDHLGSSIAQNIKDQGFMEDLRDDDQDHRRSGYCHDEHDGHSHWWADSWLELAELLHVAKVCLNVNYVGLVPVSIELSCSELLNFASKREIPVHAADGRLMMMEIGPFCESGRVECGVLDWRKTTDPCSIHANALDSHEEFCTRL